MKAYVLIQADAGGESLVSRLQEIPGVVLAEQVNGAFDAIALAQADSIRHLVDWVVARILEIPTVRRALPAPLIGSLTKRPLAEPQPLLSGPRDAAA